MSKNQPTPCFLAGDWDPWAERPPQWPAPSADLLFRECAVYGGTQRAVGHFVKPKRARSLLPTSAPLPPPRSSSKKRFLSNMLQDGDALIPAGLARAMGRHGSTPINYVPEVWA